MRKDINRNTNRITFTIIHDAQLWFLVNQRNCSYSLSNFGGLFELKTEFRATKHFTTIIFVLLILYIYVLCTLFLEIVFN